MNQIGVRNLAFLCLSASMMVVGALGLNGMISAGPGLITVLLVALVAVSFSAGVTYNQIQSQSGTGRCS